MINSKSRNIGKVTFCIWVSLVLCACSFNGTFHRPVQNPPLEELAYYVSDEDTIHIKYAQTSKEFVLRDSELRVINENYSIRNMYFVGYGGNKLNGWLLTPKHVDVKATILHFHGSAGNLLRQYQLITPLIDFGYQIFMFDYGGYGCSEGDPSHQSVLQDAYSALDYIQNVGIANNKLIIYGQSYGGYLASIVGSNSPDKIDAIVIEGAFSSFKEQARYKASVFGNFVKNEFRADEEIMNNHKPILVIHGGEDKMVPIKFGRKIYNNANQPKEFYQVNGSHCAGLEKYSKEIAAKINQMIDN